MRAHWMTVEAILSRTLRRAEVDMVLGSLTPGEAEALEVGLMLADVEARGWHTTTAVLWGTDDEGGGPVGYNVWGAAPFGRYASADGDTLHAALTALLKKLPEVPA